MSSAASTAKPSGPPRISVIVGSASDREAILPCRQTLDLLGVAHEAKVFSAHRTPEELQSYVVQLSERGFRVVIAAAGLSAALPGVIAAHTQLPVIGVPLVAGALQGVDALLTVAQMPGGVPVACMALGSAGAKNAAYLAARILALSDEVVKARLAEVVATDKAKVLGSSLPEEY
jgi:phosphoribosylaminoimidazole carboxylase PurE protein